MTENTKFDRHADMERYAKVLKALPKGKKGETGSIPCPGCGTGTVRWSRSSYNGHLWAHCSTPECFAVIQ